MYFVEDGKICENLDYAKNLTFVQMMEAMNADRLKMDSHM